jgi:RNA:NAD 2'-phosphotransferase (TPT1/KptA family)
MKSFEANRPFQVVYRSANGVWLTDAVPVLFIEFNP